MVQFLHYLWRILLMFFLLICSGFFSGSETAFFHLSRRQVSLFAGSSHRFERLIAEILRQPSWFLTTLLFGNMLVNISFFAISSVLSVNLGKEYGAGIGGSAAFFCFLSLLLFGEMLPKSIAYSHAASYCKWASMPCFLLLRTVGMVLKGLDFLLIQPLCRLLIGSRHHHEMNPVTINQVQMLLDTSRRQGLITSVENQLLSEVLKFGYLKVRHIMQPRVDMIAFDIQTPLDDIRKIMVENQIVIAPIYQENMDSIIGNLHIRKLLLHPNLPLSKLLTPTLFIPEQKTIESLLAYFQEHNQKYAIVVDEYGGLAGSVHLDDLINELAGMEEFDGEIEPVESIGPLTYRLSAQLPIHDWIEAFGIDPDQTCISTVGGLVTALLGKIAKTGDVVQWKNMNFEVERVHKNRITSVLLSLELMNHEKKEGLL